MDIDIDFLDRTKALALFKHIPASRLDNGELTRHNTGVYFHAVPVDPEKNISAIPYDKTDNLDLFKIDFLNVSIYNGVKNEQHLTELMNRTPLWDLLEQDEFSNLLFHVNGHGEILRRMKPKTVEELAAVLAMIRPAKRYLVGKNWGEVFKEVWKKPESGEYFFKKSHAHAYAMAIIVQMNLICEQISIGYS
jgi:DNA polymerase III alpha subunit